jgi:hypothetical protein
MGMSSSFETLAYSGSGSLGGEAWAGQTGTTTIANATASSLPQSTLTPRVWQPHIVLVNGEPAVWRPDYRVVEVQ